MGRYILGDCRLTELMLEANITTQELADKTGYTKQEISNWANMVKKSMALATAISMAEAIGCNIRDLYVLVPKRASEPREKRRH